MWHLKICFAKGGISRKMETNGRIRLELKSNVHQKLIRRILALLDACSSQRILLYLSNCYQIMLSVMIIAVEAALDASSPSRLLKTLERITLLCVAKYSMTVVLLISCFLNVGSCNSLSTVCFPVLRYQLELSS
jgi:hypothetical protein